MWTRVGSEVSSRPGVDGTIERSIDGDASGEDDSGDDSGLVRQLIAGSHDALAALYDRHANAVFAAALRATQDRWVAGEVVQETFLALWDRAERFDPSRGSLAAWLTAIARNRAIDHWRAAGRRPRATAFSSFADTEGNDRSILGWLTDTAEPIAMAEPEPTPEEALLSQEAQAAIAEAVASLPPDERSVIELAYDAGLTQSEIATRLGWPIGTVKTRTRRALHRLRERIERLELAEHPDRSPVGVRSAPVCTASACG